MIRLRKIEEALASMRVDDELRAEIERISTLDARKESDEVSARLLALANDLYYAGFPVLVLAAIRDLRRLVPADRLSGVADAWAMNYEALAESGLGHEGRAGQLLDEMLRRGKELDEPQVISTALQNLAVRAMIHDKSDEAVDLAVEAYRMKSELGDYYAAAQILLNLANALKLRGELDEAEELLTTFAPLVRESGDWGLEASLRGIAGQLRAERGDYEEAEASFRASLHAARRAEDRSKQVTGLQNLGSLALERDKPGQALRWFRKALDVAESSGAIAQLELVYRGMATALYRSGRSREARSALSAAYTAASVFDDDAMRVGVLNDLAALHLEQGDAQEAKLLVSEALSIGIESDDDRLVLTALRNLAITEMKLGEHAQAADHLDETLRLTVGADRETRADLYEIAIHAALAANDTTRAISYASLDGREALAIDAHGGARRQLWAATILSGSGLQEESLALYQSAVATAQQLRDASLEFDARNDYATTLADLGRDEPAMKELKALVTFARRRKNRAMEQQALFNLTEVERRRRDITSSIKHGREALRLARALGDDRAEAETLCNLGLTLTDALDLSAARDAYREAERLARRLGLEVLEAQAIEGRAAVAFRGRRFTQAADLYRRAGAKLPQDDPQQLQIQGGLLDIVTARGRTDDLQAAAQAVVTVAQQSHRELDAVTGLTEAASRWLSRGAKEEAASLFAVAILLGAVAANLNIEAPAGESPLSAEGAYTMLMPVMLLVTYVRREPGDEDVAFYDQVFQTLDDQYNGIGAQLRFVLDVARESADAPSS